MDLDILHISPTLEHIIEPILKPTETPIELALTPSIQPIVIHPAEESTHREPPTTKETQAPNTSQVKEDLRFDEMSWAWEIQEKVRIMLSHYKAQKKQIKIQEEEIQNWKNIKENLEEKLKEYG